MTTRFHFSRGHQARGNGSLIKGLVLAATLTLSGAEAAEFPAIYNSQNPKDILLPAQEALARFRVPEGFKVNLFASEPDVQQPIGMTTDEKGRLWVAENYTYSESKLNFDLRLRDRIVMMEDRDNDGHFDKRTVFWDQAQRLTSVEIGFGGVWALCPPQLLFIPDGNGDGIPDGAPEVVLDGWNDGAVRHNIANGLRWGPDGWLYGRHGIMANSLVGQPGAPVSERKKLNASIWRYHPTRKVFEVVAEGTTNPWGMDFDENGELFFINTVIGHLWHVIPGAHYRRMYGEDLNSHTYGLLEQHADHFHWDTGKSWTDSRNAKGINDQLGGGHAHSGMMIYQGDNWPERFRNTLFTVNLHGRRLNNDLLERSGSGYVGKHGPDNFFTSDPWFRAVELLSGPDGGVFIADWSDVGECHEDDGVHRGSGRIYKITYGTPAAPKPGDLSTLSEAELVQLQRHKNDWYVRKSRRVLQERAARGVGMSAVHASLKTMFQEGKENPLRALWALYVTGGADAAWLEKQLSHENEHVRVWAIRLLGESATWEGRRLDKAVAMAQSDTSGLVRLYLASTLQRLHVESKVKLAAALLAHAEDAGDHNLPLMLWYGVESLGDTAPLELAGLAMQSRIPLVRTYAARRLAELLEKNPEPLNALLRAGTEKSAIQGEILEGITQGLKGWSKAPKPGAWDAFIAGINTRNDNPGLQSLAQALGVVFGDGRALADVQKVALDEKADLTSRRAALQSLINNRPETLLATLKQVLPNSDLAVVAVRGLASFDQPEIGTMILANYGRIRQSDRPEVISALSTRPSFAKALLEAVEAGTVPRQEISAFHARQIQGFSNPVLNEKLARVWGQLRGTDEEKHQLIAKYKGILSPEALKKANPSQGRQLYVHTCAPCHKLYGQGGEVGPDLTGSGRENVDYLLENIVDPSAVVAADYKVASVTLKDGRVLNGIVGSRNGTGRTLTVQTLTERLTLEKTEVVEIQESSLSMMPEGLLEALKDQEMRDLISYLMTKKQIQ